MSTIRYLFARTEATRAVAAGADVHLVSRRDRRRLARRRVLSGRCRQHPRRVVCALVFDPLPEPT